MLTILFGACAVLSHPQTALHAMLGGALLFVFYGRNKRRIISALLVGTGVALLTYPWWGTVFMRYGFTPLLSAGQTSQRTLESYLMVLGFNGLGDYIFIPTMLLALIGVWVTVKRNEFFLITWVVLVYLIDPRGGDGIALLAESMLAGLGLLKLSAWISRSDIDQPEDVVMNRVSLFLVSGIAFYFMNEGCWGWQRYVQQWLSSDVLLGAPKR